MHIHYYFQKIVTDEHVLKMIQNSVESGDADKNDGEDAKEDDGSLTFEPKMTRSKVKDFLQKQGSVRILYEYFRVFEYFSAMIFVVQHC